MATTTVNYFQKGSACPSSKLLLSFATARVSDEVAALIKNHIAGCDFCHAELTLLKHHEDLPSTPKRPPELPINLRILAESLMSQSKTFRNLKTPEHGLLLAD